MKNIENKKLQEKDSKKLDIFDDLPKEYLKVSKILHDSYKKEMEQEDEISAKVEKEKFFTPMEEEEMKRKLELDRGEHRRRMSGRR